MTYLFLLLTNEIFYLSIFCVVLICYGVDSFFPKNKRKKNALFYFLFGALLLATVLIITISQYSIFKTLTLHSYEQTAQEYESYAINPSVKAEMRLDAARKQYVTHGKISVYLNADNEITPYTVSNNDKQQRVMRDQDDEFLKSSINNNILMCELLFISITIALIVGGVVIFFRKRKVLKTNGVGPKAPIKTGKG